MAERVGVKWTKRLLNTCMREGKIPEEWRTGLIVTVWKRKGAVHDPGKYRGITLLSHVLKMLERILDGRIRRIVECEMGEEQQGFRRWRGTADGMSTLRQLVEKKLEGQENMALGFIDLEKAYDTVPRYMVMATLRWMGIPEAEVRMVEGTYEETKGRVACGPGIPEEFRVDVGSALSPLLVVVEVISRKASTRDILRKLLYADDLEVVADIEADLQEQLVDWKEIFGKHGLNVSKKTEVLWVGQQKKDLDIRLDGKKLSQRDSFVYLGGAVCGDGGTETDICRRVQAVAGAWRKLEGVMGDRHISRKLKGNILNSCITPAYLDGLEIMAMTEKQQERLQVCENNWVRRIVGVKRIDKRRMEEMREEVGMKESLTRNLVRSRLSWAGHVEQMEGERLTKRADALGVEGRKRRGRPRLRWEDCVKRDLVVVGGNRE